MSQSEAFPNAAQIARRAAQLESLVAELERNEAELRASAEKWQSIVQNSPDFIALVGRDLTFSYLNRSVPDMDPKEMIGTKLFDYVLPEYHEMVAALNESVFATGLATQYETEGIGPDGATAWYASRLGPVIVGGHVVSVVHTVRDITERKRAEDALRESETKVRSLLDALPDTILRVHRDGTCLELRPASGGGLAGLSPDAVGKRLALILPDVAINDGLDCLGRVFAEAGPQSFEYRHGPVDAERDYEARFVTSRDDEVMIIIHDLTQRRQAERAARASETRFRQLVERAPVCILQVDLSGSDPVILAANRRAEMVYGMTAATFTSCRLSNLFAAEAAADLTRLVTRARQGQTTTMESRHLRADGAIFPVRISVAPEAETPMEQMILTVEDITAEKQRRSEIEALEEERRRIAHEIHDGLAQDLSALRLKSSLWHALVDSDPGQMHAELDELSTLLKTSIGEVRRSIFALRPLALDELGFLPAVRQLLVSSGNFYSLHPQLEVYGPAERLHSSLELALFRVIQESLNNVGQHANATSVSVTLDLKATDEIVLTVVDDGVGLTRDMTRGLSKDGHFGVQHMRERMESLGGSLSIKGEPGQGTTVRAALPASLD